jgi:hypothetical protein
MSGDGLQDIVVIRSGDVSYWPHLGNGRTSPRVTMANPPVFPHGYRDDRVHVVDIDGDGCSDIVYFDFDRTIIWLNRSGNSFAPSVEIPIAPAGSARPQRGCGSATSRHRRGTSVWNTTGQAAGSSSRMSSRSRHAS